MTEPRPILTTRLACAWDPSDDSLPISLAADRVARCAETVASYWGWAPDGLRIGGHVEGRVWIERSFRTRPIIREPASLDDLLTRLAVATGMTWTVAQ